MKRIWTICLIIVLLPISALRANTKTKFINTESVEATADVNLFLVEGDAGVDINKGIPQIRMRISNVQELLTKPRGLIKVDVFRVTDNPELVASYNYRVKASPKNLLDVRINLPEFKNQSENFEFIVYDTDGVPRTRFTQSFAAKQLLTLNPPAEGLELEDPGIFSEEEIEYIARQFSFAVVDKNQPAGMQKELGQFVFQVPFDGGAKRLKHKTRYKVNELNFDAVGSFTDRQQFDSAKKGFVFLDEDSGEIYVKSGDTAGAWSVPQSLFGQKGESGDDGTNSSGGGGSSSGGGETVVQQPFTNTTVVQNTTVVEEFDIANLANGAIASEKINTPTVIRKISLGLEDTLRGDSALLGTVAGQTVPVIRFLTNGTAVWNISLPEDIVVDDAENDTVKVNLVWSPSNSTGNPVDWELAYSSYANGDTFDASTKSMLTKTSAAPAHTLRATKTFFEIPVSALKETLILCIARRDANDIKANLASVSLSYPTNALK